MPGAASMENERDTKILVCGDVNGRFKELYRRVEAVSKKAGPFDALLCSGTFFGDDSAANDAVLSGETPPPLPTYILGPSDPDQLQYFQGTTEGCELGPNLTYVGMRGVLNTATGLSIAYLSGAEAAARSEVAFDVDSVQELCIPATANLQYQGVDVLLSQEWPSGVTKWGGAVKGDGEAPGGSALVSQVAAILKPRYHFASRDDVHYERPPYRNHKVLAEGAAQCTRFIGLASVGNAAKAKWLYAFSLRPLKFLSREALVAQPPDASEFPYDEVLRELHLEQRALAEKKNPSQFFYDVEAGPEKGRGRGRGGPPKRAWQGDGAPGEAKRSPCWFCLSSPEVQKHMVVTVANEAYMAIAKGQLADYHLLLLPIGHFQSLVSAPEPVRSEVGRFKAALRECFKLKGMGLVFWERNFRTQHLQIQGVPVPLAVVPLLKAAFQAKAAQVGIQLAEVEGEVWEAVESEGVPYFHLDLPEGGCLLTRQMADFPLQFPREVLAAADLLDVSGRVDWREVKQSKGEETDASIALRKAFHKFDFTQEDSDED